MSSYTDYQRQQIANEEYNLSLREGEPVTIDRGKTTIGYVSEIEDTASGFQAYVVTEA
ncbi:hypothetical protein [Streptococcus acidominimus]|uniref:hypothetical protein n=1 Tax=Streptococcus acidominimus TaxID=1326 RepID=UPI001430DD38|nr:hypothetical protein [Streptococcus acidominimus]MBF0819818.1 hypothetical protein [Streptococcus acidominimus]MBF0838891.1 hypothetical protein [Streptococcus acidominimus]MBF0847629.1 hypothetical protein [Streptococcus danieliae]